MIKGLWHQVRTRDGYWPKYKDRKDKNWFFEGRKVGQKLLDMGIADCVNELEIKRAQRYLKTTYRIAHNASTMSMENGRCVTVESEPEMEPCVDCDFIIFCGEKEMTCQQYRSWARQRKPKIIRMYPDKSWAQWNKEDERDELL